MKIQNLSIIIISILVCILFYLNFSKIGNFSKLKQVNNEQEKLIRNLKQNVNRMDFEIKKINLSKNFVNEKIDLTYLEPPKLVDKFNKPYGYIEFINNQLLFLTGSGQLYLYKDNEFNEIYTNLSDFFDVNHEEKEYDDMWEANPIRDILVVENIIFIVATYSEYSDKQETQPIVLRGEFSEFGINFDFFFKSNFYAESSFVDYTHGGGRLIYNNNDKHFYMAIPDYGSPIENNVSKNIGIYGKVIKILDKDKYEIISSGHRNPQGLFYDEIDNILLESEHGPSGGDEVNLIRKGLNYGWPSTSIGEGGTVIYNDHIAQGYEKPIYTWDTNPGVSQIIKVPESSSLYFNDSYVLSSLSGSSRGPEEYSGLHLYIFDVIKGKYVFKNRIFLNDRIRDMHFNVEQDSLYLVLETDQKIGIIKSK